MCFYSVVGWKRCETLDWCMCICFFSVSNLHSMGIGNVYVSLMLIYYIFLVLCKLFYYILFFRFFPFEKVVFDFLLLLLFFFLFTLLYYVFLIFLLLLMYSLFTIHTIEFMSCRCFIFFFSLSHKFYCILYSYVLFLCIFFKMLLFKYASISPSNHLLFERNFYHFFLFYSLCFCCVISVLCFLFLSFLLSKIY